MSADGATIADEVRLRKDLLTSYGENLGTIIIPNMESTDTTVVWFGMALISTSLDEESGHLTADVWLRSVGIKNLSIFFVFIS